MDVSRTATRNPFVFPRHLMSSRVHPQAPCTSSFSLDDDGERTTVYQCIIGEGSVEDQRCYLNRDTLTDMWPILRLDLAITAAWENRFEALHGRNKWLALYNRRNAN